MSRYLQINDDEPSDLSSNSGWSQFIEWSESLGDSSVKQFASSGTTDDPDGLAEDIESAMQENPPIKDVEGICETLIEYLASSEGTATVV